MRKTWTKEEHDLLTDLYDVIEMKRLAELFGVSHESIKSQISNLGLKRRCAEADYVRFPGSAKPCEILLISELYPLMPAYKIVKYLPGRDVKFVTRTVHKHQVSRTAEQSTKITRKNRGRFKKGNKSWNEGTHVVAGGRSAETRFVPGQKPANALPEFAIVPRVNKEGKPFLMIKIEGQGMKHLNRWTWEQKNGTIPEGMLVCHLDGDPKNCDITNLVLRTRAENARIAGFASAKNEMRIAKRRLSAVEKRIENARALPGDDALYQALKVWIAEAEEARDAKIKEAKSKMKTTRKAKIKKIKAAPEAVKPPKVIAPPKVVAPPKEKPVSKRKKKIADADLQRQKEELAAIKHQIKMERERGKVKRILEEEKPIDTSVGREIETRLRFEINHKTIMFVKPHKKEEFLKKYPNAKQLLQ